MESTVFTLQDEWYDTRRGTNWAYDGLPYLDLPHPCGHPPWCCAAVPPPLGPNPAGENSSDW